MLGHENICLFTFNFLDMICFTFLLSFNIVTYTIVSLDVILGFLEYIIYCLRSFHVMLVIIHIILDSYIVSFIKFNIIDIKFNII